MNQVAITTAILLFHSEARLILDGEKGALKQLVTDLRAAGVADADIPTIVKREAAQFRKLHDGTRLFSGKTICTALTESGIRQRAKGGGRKAKAKVEDSDKSEGDDEGSEDSMESRLATVESWAKAEGTTTLAILKALMALVQPDLKIAA
jgi:hypothetical protein